MRTPEEFWSHVAVKGDAECWLWQLSNTNKGYGQVDWHGHMELAHRVAFMLTYGRWPTPQANHVDDCNKSCCNPAHLYEGTAKQNAQDVVRLHPEKLDRSWVQRAKTQCPYGHPYTEENTYRNKNGGRSCRACRTLKNRARPIKTKHRTVVV